MMEMRWHLREWDLKVVALLLHAKIEDHGRQGYWIKFGVERGNKTFLAFDNGGELNIFGLGFEAKNQNHSMPLPAGAKFCQCNEDVIARKIDDWLFGEPRPYYESLLDEEDIEALK